MDENLLLKGYKPKILFQGTEKEGKYLSIRENEGNIEIVNENTGKVILQLEHHATRHGQNGRDEIIGIVLRGREQDKPKAGRYGRVWFSTDTKILYFDDGKIWLPFTSPFNIMPYSLSYNLTIPTNHYMQIILPPNNNYFVIEDGCVLTIEDGANLFVHALQK